MDVPPDMLESGTVGRNMKTTLSLLCWLSFAICVYIEQLNYRCGSILPYQDVINGDSKKWRTSPTGEAAYRSSVLGQQRGSKNFTKPLDIEQKNEFERWKLQNIRYNHLRSTVSRVGLLQYVFVPTGLLLTILCMRKHGWSYLYVFILTAFLVSGWRALTLSYFSSIGD